MTNWRGSEPRTPVARALKAWFDDSPRVVLATRASCDALAHWMDDEIGEMGVDDPRIPGYVDLIARLRPTDEVSLSPSNGAT